MDPVIQLYCAAAAFLLTHCVSSTPLRGALVGAIGEKAYLGVYSLAAFATLGWMVWAYNRAPLEPLWQGLRLLPALAMPFAFVLLACGLLSINPTAVGAARHLRGQGCVCFREGGAHTVWLNPSNRKIASVPSPPEKTRGI